jgi:putative transposase
MTNHVHLLLTPSATGAIAAMMQDLGRYVRVINALHGRTGSLWEARYRSSLVDSEAYLLTCHRYIELNPVRAGLVSDPAFYPWSSFSHYAANRPDRLIAEHPIYLGLGETPSERRAAYTSWFANSLEEHLVARIREAINTDSAIGSGTFIHDAEARLGRSGRPPARGRPRKSVTRKFL